MKNLKLSMALAFALVPFASFAQQVNGNTPPWFKVPPPNYFGAWYEWINPMEYTVTTNWTITTTGTTPTAVVTAAKGGSMVLTVTSSANDKISIVEKTANCNASSGDSFGFNVRFTTDAKVANENFFFGLQDSSSNANCLTTTTGYIANGVGLRCTAGTLELWTAKGGSATADMTTYSLGTLSNSTTYNFTVLVQCDKTTSGAGTIKVYRTTTGSGALSNSLIKTASQSVDIPNGVALYGTMGILARSTDSPVITNDYFGWACNR